MPAGPEDDIVMPVDDDYVEQELSASGSTKDGFYAQYEAKEILGTGMSSTVRRCVQKSTGKEYAVKILDVSAEKSTEEQAAELVVSTLREISILRLVAGHKHIIDIHDFFQTPTFLFVVFELASGGELFDYLTRVVTVSEKKTRSVMRQLLSSVIALHSRHIVHRDLKPENILMIDEDTIKLTDFGFAYQLSQGELLYDLCGTPGYLAPEVLKSSMDENPPGYGIEVDLWAVGVIMYTLLCGYAPFYHRKQIYMLRLITEGTYQFRSPEWDEISLSAKDLIEKLLVVDPKKRYTAEEALAHPFLAMQNIEEFQKTAEKFNAKKKFRLATIQVRALCRLLHIKTIPLVVSAESARRNPYAARKVRKHIDACAFQVYGHWIKKREQNRDVLFANTLLKVA